MQAAIERTRIDDVIIVKPELYRDERGFLRRYTGNGNYGNNCIHARKVHKGNV